MPLLDAQHDFLRARRAAICTWLVDQVRIYVARLLRRPVPVLRLLLYDEVVAALGYRSERRVGQRVVPLDAIVGTVDRGGQFDRRFRPASTRLRRRWEQIAAAMRRGEPMPPVDLVQIGPMYFVRDGHHRISVARVLGYRDIDATVTEVETVRRPPANTQLFSAT
jgi:hypothetical protein